jgi:hypothetical protein
MAMKMSDAIGGAMELVANKRFRSAIDIMERIRADTQQQGWKVIAGFQLGVIYWSEVGDGERARACFQDVANAYRADATLAGQKLTARCYANACENMMVLALSYEEYEQWATALEKVQPQNHILLHQRLEVAGARQRGVSWSEVMESTAPTYYSRNPQRPDAGKYGCAASLWQLVLRHRRDVELAFDDWATAVGEHVALTMRVATQGAMEMEKRSGRPADPREVLFIMGPSLVFVDEYLAANPGDPTVQGLRTQLVAVMDQMRGSGAGPEPASGGSGSRDPYSDDVDPGFGPTGPSSAGPPRSGSANRAYRPPSPGLALIVLAGVGAGVGWIVGHLRHLPHAWKLGFGIGLAIGLMIAIGMGVMGARLTQCAGCGRRLGLARAGARPDERGMQCRGCMRIWCGRCCAAGPKCSCGANSNALVGLVYL